MHYGKTYFVLGMKLQHTVMPFINMDLSFRRISKPANIGIAKDLYIFRFHTGLRSHVPVHQKNIALY
jgi:hypothetical protein